MALTLHSNIAYVGSIQDLPIIGDLDSINNAISIIGTRVLKSKYKGPLIRVRRSSDSAEMDIGSIAGMLDTSALLQFSGADSCYVKTMYDQSGSGRNFQRSTAAYQPLIVIAGVLQTVPGSSEPCIRFNDTVNGQAFFIQNAPTTPLANLGVFAELSITVNSTDRTIFVILDSRDAQKTFFRADVIASTYQPKFMYRNNVNDVLQTLTYDSVASGLKRIYACFDSSEGMATIKDSVSLKEQALANFTPPIASGFCIGSSANTGVSGANFIGILTAFALINTIEDGNELKMLI